MIMIMGLIDDRKNLKWQLRLGVQFLGAAILAASGVRVTLFWPFTHPLLGGVVTVLWIVGLTNSFNMLDNMDGLAASVGLIAASLFRRGAGRGGGTVRTRGPAHPDRGDGGLPGAQPRARGCTWAMPGATSLVSSRAMTVVGTYYSLAMDSPVSVLAPLLVMAVPLYDITSVVLIRIREGRSPFQGDRRHFRTGW